MVEQELKVSWKKKLLNYPLSTMLIERHLYKYQENQIIIIGVIYVKKTQKTPKEILKLAQKRLKNI